MRVTVLYGGPSAEREVSLVSGRAVIDGLKSMGHEVFGSDVSPSELSGLDRPADVIFPVLHGQFGESGDLQEILAARKLPFVGSGCTASRGGIGIDGNICTSLVDRAEKIQGGVEKHGEALVEQDMKGPELTVGVLEEK